MSPPRRSDLPRLFVIDPARLAQVRRRVAAGDETLEPAVRRLRGQANNALKAGPFSVMDKTAVPPSGDKHDYMSRGPYWWPDPTKPDGLPYMRRDGRVNRDSRSLDSVPLGRMASSVATLALAYYLTSHEPYAGHAAKLLRTWFLDDATRMSPHLKYGQGIPGRCTGRGIGIIDTTRLVSVVDAVGMLEGSEAWSDADQKALQEWFRRYLRWLLASGHGRAESRASNNHGTWYDVQVASYALFVGRPEVAKKALEGSARKRIAAHIEPDGRQPRELARTKAFSYSTMNLTGLFHLASLGDRAGVDLWHYQTRDGRCIRKALDWLIPFATGQKPWRHKQIRKLHPASLFPLLRRAATAYAEPRYEALIGKLQGADTRADRTNLLYPNPQR